MAIKSHIYNIKIYFFKSTFLNLGCTGILWSCENFISLKNILLKYEIYYIRSSIIPMLPETINKHK